MAAASFTAAICLCAPAHAAITFQFDFGGTFLTDPNSAAEKAAVIKSSELYSAQFAKYFSNSGTVELQATGFNDINSNNLANASAFINFADAPTPGFIQQFVSNTGLNWRQSQHGGPSAW